MDSGEQPNPKGKTAGKSTVARFGESPKDGVEEESGHQDGHLLD